MGNKRRIITSFCKGFLHIVKDFFDSQYSSDHLQQLQYPVLLLLIICGTRLSTRSSCLTTLCNDLSRLLCVRPSVHSQYLYVLSWYSQYNLPVFYKGFCTPLKMAEAQIHKTQDFNKKVTFRTTSATSSINIHPKCIYRKLLHVSSVNHAKITNKTFSRQKKSVKQSTANNITARTTDNTKSYAGRNTEKN